MIRYAFLFGAVTLALNLLAPGLSAQSTVDLKVGDPAPVFEVKDDMGKEWKSVDHVGKKVVVVYFYPADLTGGCTKQACGFRDNMKSLTDKGVEVVGVSGDSVENHKIFKKEHNLNFALLADTEGKVATKFGVPHDVGQKSAKVKADGKDIELLRNVSAKRWTFVIDKSGKIASKNTSVNAPEDAKAVEEVVNKLK